MDLMYIPRERVSIDFYSTIPFVIFLCLMSTTVPFENCIFYTRNFTKPPFSLIRVVLLSLE
jgi:hypothetical protein